MATAGLRMDENRAKCIIILSNKSSGSSACQDYLAKYSKVKCVEKTRHNENETLYWTKAASILGMPQKKMLDSEVPISEERARLDLIDLLEANIDSFNPPDDDFKLVIAGWAQLCQKYKPVFIEKSPHHLYQWSALELIAKCIESLPEVEFCIIGLVRNPMDTLYSSWKRWGILPQEYQYEWLTAYGNLLKLKERINNNFYIIRYEDMISDPYCMKPILMFAGQETVDNNINYFHSSSITKWKKNKYYGFSLKKEVIQMAQKYGYEKKELENDTNYLWPVYSQVFSLMKKGKRRFRRMFNRIYKI